MFPVSAELGYGIEEAVGDNSSLPQAFFTR